MDTGQFEIASVNPLKINFMNHLSQISPVEHNDIEVPAPPIVTFRDVVRHCGTTVGIFAFRYSTVTLSRGQASTTSRQLLHCKLIMIENE